MTEDELIDRLTAELEQRERESPIELVLRPVVALQLAVLLQLALKHPEVADTPRAGGVLILGYLKRYFADAPAISEVLRRGDP